MNPIEKVERSSLIIASTIHHTAPADLIANEQLARVATYSPMLIAAADEDNSIPLISTYVFIAYTLCCLLI